MNPFFNQEVLMSFTVIVKLAKLLLMIFLGLLKGDIGIFSFSTSCSGIGLNVIHVFLVRFIIKIMEIEITAQ